MLHVFPLSSAADHGINYFPGSYTIIRAAFVCLFVPYVLRGPSTDLRQTWWVYVG